MPANIPIERVLQYLGEEVVKRRSLEDELVLWRREFNQLKEALEAKEKKREKGK